MIAERANLLRWTPRVLSITLAIFMSMVSHDLIAELRSEPVRLMPMAGVSPALLMIMVLTIAWKRPRTAAIILLILAVAWFLASKHHPELASAVGVPLMVNALLYWLCPGPTDLKD